MDTENSLSVVKKFEQLNFTVLGTYDRPLFIAQELGNYLGIKNISSSISSFDEDEKQTLNCLTESGKYKSKVVLTEAGLYKLLFISKKDEAKKFQK